MIIFHVFAIANQLLSTSLALFSAMNEWQRSLFLKRDLSRPLLVSI